MKTVQQILIDARALILRPECWIQSVSARDAEGFQCNPIGPAACCWCSIGATMRASGAFPEPQPSPEAVRRYETACTILSAAADVISVESEETPLAIGIVDYNDYKNREHKDVIRVFDRAIEAASVYTS